MHKDFKIGLSIGLLLVIGAIVWLCTLPKLSTKSRALENVSSRSVEQPAPVTIIPQPAVKTEPAASAQQPARVHVVEKGQTLSQIAEQYYGSQRQWLKILNANRDTLPDPNRLTPGLKLIIPE
jgi:nucleoid-associated protein YgaU